MKTKYGFAAFTILGCLLASGCGSSTPPPGPAAGTAAPQAAPGSPGSFNLKDAWNVQAKTCSGQALAPGKLESYKLDGSHLVRVALASEDDTTVCKLATTFDRVISASTQKPDGYSETSTLRASAAKKSCWTKQPGAAGEPTGRPTSSQAVDFAPEQLGAALWSDGSHTKLDLQGSQDCASGTLHLELQRVAQDPSHHHQHGTPNP